MQYFGVIVAAGVGSRFNSPKPKQYYELAGKSILEHSIESLLAFKALVKLVVVLHPDDVYWPTLPISQHEKIMTTIGGLNRSDSSLNGLKALAEFAKPNDFVLIHDAARPFIKLEDLENLTTQTAQHLVGGILAAKVVDTIKYSTNAHTIEKTVDRNSLYRALTPQCFRYDKLKQALNFVQSEQIAISDDAMALELQGFQPLLVLTDAPTMKLTYASDLNRMDITK